MRLCQGPNVLDESDLIEMGVSIAAHRLAILRAASSLPPLAQTGSCSYINVNYVIILI